MMQILALSYIVSDFFSVGCEVFNNTSFDLKNSTFSQAPGAEVILSCSLDTKRDIAITCQDDGQWEPNPNDMLCTSGKA